MSNFRQDANRRQTFLFFLAQEVHDEERQLVGKMVEQLSTSRTWVVGAPQFIDTVEHDGIRAGDLPTDTVGGAHEIYSALIPDGIPYEIDALHLDEIEYIVDFVRRVSLEYGLEFEFELDGVYVGTVEDGVVDATLAKGLIEEWRHRITHDRLS